MSRIACVHVPAFSLQLLLRSHPDWRAFPAAVVAEDKPLAPVLEVNEIGRKAGILPGMRYAAALSLTRDLRAGTADPARVREALSDLTERLRRSTPHVEREEDPPGTFWLDASGQGLLHPSLGDWALAVRTALLQDGWQSSVVVGWRRFSTRAVACEGPGIVVFPKPGDEMEASQQVPLARLEIDPRVRDALSRLGIARVGDLLRLPETGLHERFGEATSRLRRLAAGLEDPPRPAVPEPEPLVLTRALPAPEDRATALLFVAKGLLPDLLRRLSARSQALRALHLDLALDHAPAVRATVRPAEPTLDEGQLVDLLRLKLESLPLAAGCEEMSLSADAVPISWEAMSLFSLRLRRDPDAAGRALARVRAELGDEAVVTAELVDGHLPEARFRWVPLERLPPAHPIAGLPPRLVRRIEGRPRPLAGPEQHTHDNGWLPGGHRLGPVVRDLGPYEVSGGWWRSEVHRAYHFLETRRGDLLWVYWDGRRRRWFLQGRVD